MSFAGIEDLKPMARGVGPGNPGGGVGVNPLPIIRIRPLSPPSDITIKNEADKLIKPTDQMIEEDSKPPFNPIGEVL